MFERVKQVGLTKAKGKKKQTMDLSMWGGCDSNEGNPTRHWGSLKSLGGPHLLFRLVKIL